nr:hypothetical protein [uncultured Brachyspira sp.]
MYYRYIDGWCRCKYRGYGEIVTTPGEGLVLAICKVFPVKFGNTKIAFDVTLVLISLTTILIYLGHLEGG